ncbi:MAG TPA: type I 3-dehydroquinate dehydratase [Bacillota bacterium]|nr:type I 3-dehydroquinate dehydratase [Bacillota bacterium]
MNAKNNIVVKGKVMGDGSQPLICTPLIGLDKVSLLNELDQVLLKKPDIIEWRVDFFRNISNTDQVIEVARKLQDKAGDVPILFTIRSNAEGGEAVKISYEEIVELFADICRSRSVDFIDFELSNNDADIRELRKVSRENGILMIMSYHNFQFTPSEDTLQKKVEQAEAFGADIAKIAVMPQGLEDVLLLLSLTLHAKNNSRIPLISISMGKYGFITRTFGWMFGSAFTFAVGENSSAPGQVPIDDLKTITKITQKILGNE